MMRRHDTTWSLRESRRKRPIFRRTGSVCAFPGNPVQCEQKRGAHAWKGNAFRPYTTWQAFIAPVLPACLPHYSLT